MNRILIGLVGGAPLIVEGGPVSEGIFHDMLQTAVRENRVISSRTIGGEEVLIVASNVAYVRDYNG